MGSIRTWPGLVLLFRLTPRGKWGVGVGADMPGRGDSSGCGETVSPMVSQVVTMVCSRDVREDRAEKSPLAKSGLFPRLLHALREE